MILGSKSQSQLVLLDTMHSLNLGATALMLAFTSLSFFSLPSQAKLNNKGSSMCAGHHNQLQSLIRQLKEAPFLDLTTFSGSGKRESVGCITFSNLNAVAIGFEWAIPGFIAYLGTALTNKGSEGDGALCAFYQGTRGASFTLQRTIDSLNTLSTVGDANPCGSIPINWPYNNDTGGILTMNYVDGAPCDGFCAGNKDLALPANTALKMDPNYGYAPGWCGVHFTWYQQTKDITSYYLDVAIRDANKILVGEAHYVEANTNQTVLIDSKLPWVFEVTVQSDTSPLLGIYAGGSMEQCVCDDFQDGFKMCNCGFTCGQSLGLLNPS